MEEYSVDKLNLVEIANHQVVFQYTQEKRVTSACYRGLPRINFWAVQTRSIAVFISMRWLCCLRLAIRSDSSWPSERLMAE